jgi:serine/threonine-protein kinase
MDQWQQVEDLFHATLGKDGADRTAFLAAACGGDESLRREVEDLIAAHDSDAHFIDQPAFEAAARVLAVTPFTPGQTVGHYEIRSLIGEGGMGVVYLAEDRRLQRRIALKLLPPQFTIEPERVRRFEQEARAASALNHPSIVTIHEIGTFDGTQFMVTEFVDGHTLRHLMNEKPFTINEALNVVIQIAEALQAAHSAGIVHRDIKPENIMLRSDGYVKVLDFGLAKLTEQVTDKQQLERSTLLQSNPGLVMGTVQYMSPEQARGKVVDARTDIWSLGVLLYELLAGRVPFTGETASHVMVSLMEDELQPLIECASVPPELDRIVTKALRKNKKERYQTAKELVRDLKNVKQELQLQKLLKDPPAATVGRAQSATGSAKLAEMDGTASARTAAVGVTHPTSSAEYLVSQITQHKRGAMLAAATVLVIAAIVIYLFVMKSHYFDVAGETIDSVAVLPFANVGNDPNAEYLSDGMSDSLINSLSRLSTLKKVISFNSVLRYKGKNIDPQAVGRELNVRAVLMGRVTLRGDELLITAELVDVSDNKRLWGEQYNRKLADVSKLQGEMANEITERLRLKLTGEQKERLAKSHTDNPEAYRLYLLGRFYRRNRLDFQKAVDYLEQAIKIDPNFASAYAQLAYVYHNLAFSPSQHQEASQKAEWAARKALELDDTIGDAHAVLGLLNKDLKELERALELDPNSPDTQSFYAKMLWSKRLDEAIPHMRRAQELDPLSPVMYVDLGKMLNSARRFDEAMQQYRKALELNPNFRAAHRNLALCFAVQGRYEEAIAEADRTRSSEDGSDNLELRGYIYGRWGKRAEALKMLDELSKRSDVSPHAFALIYTGLGDKDKAFEFLRKKYPAPLLPPLRVDPVWDSLRSDPRFEEVLRQRDSREE